MVLLPRSKVDEEITIPLNAGEGILLTPGQTCRYTYALLAPPSAKARNGKCQICEDCGQVPAPNFLALVLREVSRSFTATEFEAFCRKGSPTAGTTPQKSPLSRSTAPVAVVAGKKHPRPDGPGPEDPCTESARKTIRT
jgi:hypothetical protein